MSGTAIILPTHSIYVNLSIYLYVYICYIYIYTYIAVFLNISDYFSTTSLTTYSSYGHKHSTSPVNITFPVTVSFGVSSSPRPKAVSNSVHLVLRYPQRERETGRVQAYLRSRPFALPPPQADTKNVFLR